MDPTRSEAKTVVNPSGPNGKIGTFIVPPGQAVPTGTISAFTGLVSTDGDALDLSTLPSLISNYTNGLIGYSAAGAGNGVTGYTTGSSSAAVYAYTVGQYCNGVGAVATGINSVGVYGYASNTNSTGVYGDATNMGSYAGYFNGNVHLTGTLTGGTKSFKIDHPLDPSNKYLYHTSVESSEMKNIYDGVVTLDNQGEAIVEMPEWFEALNADFRYLLTSIGAASPNLHIAQKIEKGKFNIGGGQAGQEVSWMVTGIRQDAYAKAHRSPVEQEKTGDEKGKYLHPELFSQPEEMSVGPRPVKAKK